MATPGVVLKKKDLQKIAQAIQEFQSKILCDVDAAKLRDALNLTLLQMQTYWKILKKKQDRSKADKFTWPWFDLRNPQNNTPQYLASSLYGAGVQKEALPPLFDLLSAGNVEKCEELVGEQGYKGEQDALGRTPLHYVAGVSALQLHTKFFVQHGCDINHQAHDGSTALHRAVINENVTVVEDLLQCNADASVQDCEGRSPVHWAVISQETGCLQLLIKYNANIDIPDKEHETPIMWSVAQGNAASLKVLLSSPSGPKLARTTDNRGQTLLHRGVGYPDIVNLLLNSETVHERDKYERNVVHHAALNGALDTCRIVEEQFQLINLMSSDSDGRTPVHYAVNNAHSSVTNYLLEHGGSTTTKDMQGLSPYSIAELKQLHYCSIVISAYHQGLESESRSSLAAGTSPRQPKPVAPVKPSPPAPSLDQQPNDRRVVIRNKNNSLSKSSPGLKLQPPLSTITPGLLRHSPVTQKPSRLRELTDIRDKITGRSEPAAFPSRPSSSRGKRNARPSSPLLKEEIPLPWKLNNIPPKPPPSRHEVLSNGELSDQEMKDIPARPKTARGNNPDYDELSREESGILDDIASPRGRDIVEDIPRNRREEMRISPRYGKVEPIVRRNSSENVVVEQTLEIVHSLPDNKPLIKGSPLRSNTSLLGPMPVLQGKQQICDPNPWYKKKLNPVPPNKMDILQPENPPPLEGD